MHCCLLRALEAALEPSPAPPAPHLAPSDVRQQLSLMERPREVSSGLHVTTFEIAEDNYHSNNKCWAESFLCVLSCATCNTPRTQGFSFLFQRQGGNPGEAEQAAPPARIKSGLPARQCDPTQSVRLCSHHPLSGCLVSGRQCGMQTESFLTF